MTKRTMLFVLAIFAALSMLGTAQAQEKWRLAHKQTADSIEGRMFQLFADNVKSYTNGQIEITVYPSEQLGKDDTVLEQLQIGTIQIYVEAPEYLQKWVRDIKWIAAPFVFDDRAHWARFMDSDMAKGWFATVEDKAGIAVIGSPTAFLRGPYRVMASKKKWSTLAEMQGLKLRMHPEELSAAVWRHLGAEVRTLPWTEVYESIGRGVVEAVNAPISLIEPMKFYEVAPNIVRHDEFPQGMAFMINARIWKRLPEKQRADVLRAYNDMAKESFTRTMAIGDRDLANMKAKGATFAEANTTEFVERMKSFYKKTEASGDMPAGFLAAIEATRKK